MALVINFNLAKLVFRAQRPKMKVLIWFQGEDDVSGLRANNYQVELANLVSNLKMSGIAQI